MKLFLLNKFYTILYALNFYLTVFYFSRHLYFKFLFDLLVILFHIIVKNFAYYIKKKIFNL